MTDVVISGIGLITALGVGTEPTWQGLTAGRSAIGPITAFDPSGLRTRLAAPLDDFRAATFVTDRRALRNMTRDDQLAVAAAALAAEDAKLTVPPEEAERAGLYLAGQKEISDPAKVLDAVLLARDEDGSVDLHRLGTKSAAEFYPLFYVEGLQAASLFYVSKAHGLKGANSYLAGAGDASLAALALAAQAVRHGEATVALAGGFDAATGWWSACKADVTGELSPEDDPARACRPYHPGRNGHVLGDGAAVLVVESGEHAAARGVRPYARILGSALRFDPDHDGPHRDGATWASAVTGALAGTDPALVDCVVAEGRATVLGDLREADGLRRALGDRAPAVAATTTTPATGHVGAAAGALAAAVAALTVASGRVPPVSGLTDVDPECAGPGWVRGAAVDREVRRALALGRGPQGQHAALLIGAIEEPAGPVGVRTQGEVRA